MTENPPLISVIIPTYNNAHIVPRVVASVFNQSMATELYELIVIDDGSTDGTRDKLGVYDSKPNFHYIYQDNSGRSAARNRGISEARGEILVFLDSDKVIEVNVLEEHLKYQHKFKNAAVIGQTLLPDEILNANIYMQVTHEGEVKPIRERKLQFSYFVTGNLSIQKKLVEEAGRFDETFKVYGWEDSELGLRLVKLGVELIYNPKIICYHHHVHDFESQIVNMKKVGQSAWVFTQKQSGLNLKLFLGLHPINFGLCKILSTFPGLLDKAAAKIKRKQENNEKAGLAFLYNLLKQYHYIKSYLNARENARV